MALPLSLTQVANLALVRLGEPRIVSLDEQSTGAAAIREVLPMARTSLLASHPWIFATRRTMLPSLAEPPAWGFGRAYQLPGDCLRLLQVGEDPHHPPPYEIEERRIFSDAEAPLAIRYIVDKDDAAQWDPLFADALAARLARDLADKVTQSTTRFQLLDRSLEAAMQRARRGNALQRLPQSLPHGSWHEARFG